MNSQLKEQIKHQIAALEGAVPKEARHQVSELKRSFGEVRREMAALNIRLKQSHDDCEAVRNGQFEIAKKLEQANRNLATLQGETRSVARSRQDLEESLQILIESIQSLVTLVGELETAVEIPLSFNTRFSKSVAARLEDDEARQSAMFLKVFTGMLYWASLDEEDASLGFSIRSTTVGVVIDICDPDSDGIPDVHVDLL
jgi:uncharacterized protein YoxC